ncbi:MAG: hypothetical protein LBH39_07695, partial [Clostridiales Family XIII bacterium]|nr:hypothetical protein [Clostridiales Family XIII bacterium]
KRLECTNLRNKCSNEIHGFRWLIDAYRKLLKGEPGQGGSAHSEKPETYREEIEKELARSSIFAAFKRKIVRDEGLAEDFSEALK